MTERVTDESQERKMPRKPFKALFAAGAAMIAITLSSPLRAQDEIALPAANATPRSATADDMTLFEPYIGRFRSDDKTADNGTVFHYEIDYDWYDRNHSIVSYALTVVVPANAVRRHIGSGYYYLDRVNGRIGVFGVFPDGRVGNGTMGEFDPETSTRAVWVTGVAPDGTQTQVHDRFEIIDENSWSNVTHIRRDGGDWQQMGSDTYTRIADPEDGPVG